MLDHLPNCGQPNSRTADPRRCLPVEPLEDTHHVGPRDSDTLVRTDKIAQAPSSSDSFTQITVTSPPAGLLCVTGENVQSFRECGIDCEDTGEVPTRPGLTQELTGFVPCQRFVGRVGWAPRTTTGR
jgi:hypothetical protein